MEIRKAREEDTPDLEELFFNTRIHTFKWHDECKFHISDFKKWVEDEEVYVAVLLNKIVGFISIYMPNNFIHNLFVHVDYQRRGIGKKLLEKVLPFVFEPITLKVELLNKSACLFYEKFGFKLVSTHKNEEQPYYLYKYDSHFIKIATFQGRIKEKNISYTLQKIKENLEFCEKNEVDILCMPECYLQGYFEQFLDAMENSINLNSHEFKKLCFEIEKYSTTLIVGLNEEEKGKVYNTVVMIENGICIGKYRKAYTYTPYDYFECGDDFPVFEKKGVKYGVIICFDAAFIEPSRILALNGAQIIFCPSFNRTTDISEQNITEHLDKRTNFICRAYENRIWFVSSDIVWDADGSSVCSGYSSILDQRGNFIVKGTPFKEELLVKNIPKSSLRTYSNELIFSGKKKLNEFMYDAYFKFVSKRNSSFKLTFELEKEIDFNLLLELKSLLKKSIYHPTDIKMQSIIKNFTDINAPHLSIFCAYSCDIMYTAITETALVGCAFIENTTDKIIIHYLASKEELRGRGIASKLIKFISGYFLKQIEAETDDDAVLFYKKIGFKVEPFEDEKYKITRYKCIYYCSSQKHEKEYNL